MVAAAQKFTLSSFLDTPHLLHLPSSVATYWLQIGIIFFARDCKDQLSELHYLFLLGCRLGSLHAGLHDDYGAKKQEMVHPTNMSEFMYSFKSNYFSPSLKSMWLSSWQNLPHRTSFIRARASNEWSLRSPFLDSGETNGVTNSSQQSGEGGREKRFLIRN